MPHLLLVENDPAAASLWRETLTDAGWTVTHAAGCREALGLGGDRFEVLVTEAELPDGEGLELARALRRSRPSLRVLLLAASSPELLPADVGLLPKPFGADVLPDALERLPSPAPSDAASPVAVRWLLPTAAALLAVLVAFGLRHGLAEPSLPEPSGRASVTRGDELRTIEPRGDVEHLERMRWTEARAAARYVVWIRRLDDSVVWQTSVTRPEVDLATVGLRVGVPYRWEIEAFDAEGRRIALSEAATFRWVTEEIP